MHRPEYDGERATKTSFKKWIRASSNFIALLPSCLIRQMFAKDCIQVQEKKLLSCVPVLDKTWLNKALSRRSRARTAKKCTKLKEWCICKKKNALYLSVKGIWHESTNWGHHFYFANWKGTAILRCHPSHAEYPHFSVILRPWVLFRPRESNPRPAALHSSTLPTELILPRESCCFADI